MKDSPASQNASIWLQKILAVSSQIFYLYDIRSQIFLYASPSLYEELGYTETEFLQMDESQMASLIHPEDLSNFRDHRTTIMPLLKDKEVVKIEYRLRHKRNHEYIWLESKESVYERDENGQILSVIGIADNISEKRAIQLHLSRTSQELEQFIFSVSHDLRAPVRHIETYVNILGQTENTLSEEELRLVNKIASATERAGKMIDELVQFSRNKQALPNKTHFDSFQLVMHLADHVSSFFPDQIITWDIQPLPDCYADLNMLTTVWENLISNAIKFSSRKPETYITIAAVEKPYEIEFSISDNGIGFDMKFVDKLFHIFQRLHTQREFSGTGIGLAIVRQIIIHHNGRIWVESAVGQGTTFHFTLPKK
ncbi:MAG: ATP-binding protein [Bacteroidia bacterium]